MGDFRLSDEARSACIRKTVDGSVSGPAFGAANRDMQSLQLQVLLSIDQRLSDISFYLQNQEERAQQR